MEVLLVVLFAVVLTGSYLARDRWVTDAPAEPWLLLLGAIALMAMAWGWGSIETRGASVILTACALLPLFRALQLLRQKVQGTSHGPE